MVTTRPPKTIVQPTALGPVANTDTKLLVYGLFQKGRVLAQDGIDAASYASMGPRSHERGNAKPPSVRRRCVTVLQWGRVLMNAETC